MVSLTVPAIPRRTRYLILAIALLVLFSGTYRYYDGEVPYWMPNYVDCETRIANEGIPPTPPSYLGRVGVPSDEQLTRGARVVSATELMALAERLKDGNIDVAHGELTEEKEMVRRIQHSMIIHQSWKNSNASTYPLYYAAHSHLLWQARHPGWLYVLWDDAENRSLVSSRYPQWLTIYDSMKKNIMRADFVRNLYMHTFGGVYADLDVSPLGRTDLFLPFDGPADISSSPPPHIRRTPTPTTSPYDSSPTVFVAAMSSAGPQSIPNAWMASTRPGHQLWTRIAARSAKLIKDGTWGPPEVLTGPEPLFFEVERWKEEAKKKTVYERKQEDLVVLGQERIFPYSWAGARKTEHCLCSPRYPNTFEPDRCASLYPDAWALSFWGSSWSPWHAVEPATRA